MPLASGHEIEEVVGKEAEALKRDFIGYTNAMIHLNPGRWLLPIEFTQYADKIYNFEFRTDDVMVMTFMKVGTTWMQEIVWTMRNSPNLEHPSQNQGINNRVPFYDCDMFLSSKNLPPPDPNDTFLQEFFKMCPGKNPSDGVFLQIAEATPSPRTIKTHMPISLISPRLLETAKVVYVARNPKDVLLSYYHHARLFKAIEYVGTFDQFFNYFLNDDMVYGPYWLHVKEAWEKRHHPNLHFVFYEDLKANIMGELNKINTFLNTNLNDQQLEKIREFTSFPKMKERDNLFTFSGKEDPFVIKQVLEKDGGFFRKGESGGWKARLSEDQNQRMDGWINKHFTNHGITFPTDHL